MSDEITVTGKLVCYSDSETEIYRKLIVEIDKDTAFSLCFNSNKFAIRTLICHDDDRSINQHEITKAIGNPTTINIWKYVQNGNDMYVIRITDWTTKILLLGNTYSFTCRINYKVEKKEHLPPFQQHYLDLLYSKKN